MGIELTDTELNLVYIKTRNDQLKLVKMESISLPDGLVKNGIILQPDNLLQHLSPKLKAWKWKPKRINFLAPSQHVINRYIRIPDVQGKEMHHLIHKEVEYYLHFPFDDPMWDYFDMGLCETEPGKRDILISAMSSSILLNQIDFFQELGMQVTAVDIRGIALLRVVHQAVPPSQRPDTYAVLQLGKKSADINVYHNDQLRFNRNISYTAENRTADLEVAASGELQEGHPMKFEFGLIARELLNELSRSMDFFKFSILNQDVPIDKVYLTGLSGILQALKDTDVNFPWTFEDLTGYVDSEGNEPMSPLSTTAFGLALKKAGYRL
jgi:type IV pilus assembly protein PilM